MWECYTDRQKHLISKVSSGFFFISYVAVGFSDMAKKNGLLSKRQKRRVDKF